MTYHIVKFKGVKYLPVSLDAGPDHKGSLCKYCAFGFSNTGVKLSINEARKMCTEAVPRANVHACDTTEYGIVYAEESDDSRTDHIAAKLMGKLEQGQK